jgi:hypothetical protein
MTSSLSHRACWLLELMHEPDRELSKPDWCPPRTLRGREYMEDGEWFKLLWVPMIGRKTITELIKAGAIESRFEGSSFRLVDNNPDFGDLWVG